MSSVHVGVPTNAPIHILITRSVGTIASGVTLAGNSAILFELLDAVADNVNNILVTNTVDDVALCITFGVKGALSKVLNVLLAADTNRVVTLAVVNIFDNLQAIADCRTLVGIVLFKSRAAAPVTTVVFNTRVDRVIEDGLVVDGAVIRHGGAILCAHGNVDCARRSNIIGDEILESLNVLNIGVAPAIFLVIGFICFHGTVLLSV